MTTRNKRTFRARDARQGHIVLKSRSQRTIFIVGLAGMALLAILMAVLAA